MTEQNPAIFLQAGSHPAEDVRRMIAGLSTDRAGVILRGTTDLKVTEKSGTANMSVDVADGMAFVKGSSSTYQGMYFVENRGTKNLTIAAANATNPRWDLIVAKVEDAFYAGATNAWSLSVVTGTAAASPSDPAVPASCIVLARVVVPASATSIVNANITDLRAVTQNGFAAAPGGTIVTTSAARPASPFEGMTIYETDTDRFAIYTGSAWRYYANTNYLHTGTHAGTVPSGTAGSDAQAVSFGVTFASAPNVTISITQNSNADFIASIETVSTTGFTFRIVKSTLANVGSDTPYGINYHAVGALA